MSSCWCTSVNSLNMSSELKVRDFHTVKFGMLIFILICLREEAAEFLVRTFIFKEEETK